MSLWTNYLHFFIEVSNRYLFFPYRLSVVFAEADFHLIINNFFSPMMFFCETKHLDEVKLKWQPCERLNTTMRQKKKTKIYILKPTSNKRLFRTTNLDSFFNLLKHLEVIFAKKNLNGFIWKFFSSARSTVRKLKTYFKEQFWFSSWRKLTTI